MAEGLLGVPMNSSENICDDSELTHEQRDVARFLGLLTSHVSEGLRGELEQSGGYDWLVAHEVSLALACTPGDWVLRELIDAAHSCLLGCDLIWAVLRRAKATLVDYSLAASSLDDVPTERGTFRAATAVLHAAREDAALRDQDDRSAAHPAIVGSAIAVAREVFDNARWLDENGERHGRDERAIAASAAENFLSTLRRGLMRVIGMGNMAGPKTQQFTLAVDGMTLTETAHIVERYQGEVLGARASGPATRSTCR